MKLLVCEDGICFNPSPLFLPFLVVQDNFGRKYLQLPRMLLRYIKEFGQSEPSIAADYIA